MTPNEERRPDTGSPAARRGTRPDYWRWEASGDIEDAEFETIDPAPAGREQTRIARGTQGARGASGAGSLAILIRGGEAPAPREPGLPGRGYWTVVGVVAAIAFWVSGGHVLATRAGGHADTGGRLASQLRIEGLTARTAADGEAALLVGGRVRNAGGAGVEAPPVVVAVQDSRGATMRYYLGTRGHFLAPDEHMNFSSRLPAPADGIEGVNVYFETDGKER